MSRQYEVEVLEGLVPLAREEVEGAGMKVLGEHADGLTVRARRTEALKGLRLATAVYRRLAFDVPRPKALLGDQHFRRLTSTVREVAAGGTFRGFRFAAAGADSPVFRRLARALQEATGMPFDAEAGELLLRVRPVPLGRGWEVLVRLTPRPLSARSWRVCNLAGGLNATLAAAMVRLAGVRQSDRYLNLMCGSGTLLAERYLAGPTAELVGVDLDEGALACARANLDAAGAADACRLLHADVRSAPLDEGAYDVIVADLPWGDAVGSHDENRALHPALLAAADRLATADARVVLLTHELRLFGRVLAEQDRWRLEFERRVEHGGHFPHLYLLRRA
ncbi:MAG: methyltransferase domain-containing protein [Deinococcales bacterium]